MLQQEHDNFGPRKQSLLDLKELLHKEIENKEEIILILTQTKLWNKTLTIFPAFHPWKTS